MKRPPATPPVLMRAARTAGSVVGMILFLFFLGEVVAGKGC